MSFAIKKFSRVLTRQGKVLRHSTQKLHHLGQVIIILIIVISLSWLEEKISSNHFKDSTCKGPNISSGIIISSNDDFRRSILASLNLRCKVMMSPATITHITDLNHDFIIQLSTTLALQILKLFGHFFHRLLFLSSQIFIIFQFFKYLVITVLILINVNFDIVDLTHWLFFKITVNVDQWSIPITFTLIYRWACLWIQILFSLFL